jgi:hypothetical protein
MHYDADLHETRTDADQSETGGDFRVSFESMIRGKKLAPRKAKPNPLDRLFKHSDGPYVAHFVRGEWQVWWDGGVREPLLRFAADDEELAVTAMKWLACKWRVIATRKVYFIGTECRVGARVKIGIAYEPKQRLSNLRTANPDPLELLATMPGDKPEEARLHRKFSRSRVSGEWFTITPALKRTIENAREAMRPSNSAPPPTQEQTDDR